MSDHKGPVLVPNPRKSALEWAELYRSGRREEADAHLRAEEERSRNSVAAAVEVELAEMEKARG